MTGDSPQALFARAVQLHGNSQLDVAETLYRQVLQLDPEFPECQHKLGLCLFTQGHHSEGLEMFQQAVAGDSHNAQYWTSYIHALLLTRSVEAGESAYANAVEQGVPREELAAAEQLIFNTRYAGSLKKLGRLLEQGKPDQVKVDSAVLLATCPKLGLAWKIRSIAMQSTGDEETEEALNNAIRFLPNDYELLNNLGVWLRAQGRLEESEARYRQALALNPNYADAHGNLANLLMQTARPEEAESEFKQALKANPELTTARNNLANLLINQKQHKRALEHLEKILQSHSGMPEVHNNMGVVLSGLGQHEAAAESFRRAIQLWPDYGDAHANLGQALVQLNKSAEAESAFKKALELQPDWIETLNDLANLYAETGREQAAGERFEQALALKPNHVMTLSNYGNFLVRLGNFERARKYLYEAVRLDSTFVDAYYNLGVLEADAGNLEQAIIAYRRALQIAPGLHKAHNNLAIALKDRGRYEEAQQHMSEALAQAPDNGEYQNNAGVLLLEMGQLTEAERAFRSALNLDISHFSAHSNLLFAMNYRVGLTAQEYMDEAGNFGVEVARHRIHDIGWANERSVEKVLQIGIVSADLHRHPVGYFATEVLTSLSRQFRDSLQIHVFANQQQFDDLSAQIREVCSSWTGVVHLSDSEVVDEIRRRKIDILIDLSGHTAGNRLPVFAWKPTPVSLSWLGYYASTGVNEIDYFIADHSTVPENSEEIFSEKVIRLPDTRFCYSKPEYDCEVNGLPCEQTDWFTFASFNNLPKINGEVISTWATLLERVSDSRLLLKAKQFDSEEICARVKHQFSDRGVDGDRILLEGPSSRQDYLRRFNDVDLCLDPFPFPGGTTTCDSLWMGVPVITLAGDRLISRQGLGILRMCGLEEFIAGNVDEYIELAVKSACDRKCLGQLRSGLRERALNSPLFDSDVFARHFQSTLREIWQDWCTKAESIDSQA